MHCRPARPDASPYPALIESQPLDITESGTYEFIVEATPEQLQECSGWAISGDLETFTQFYIPSPNPTGDTGDTGDTGASFATREIDARLRPVLPMEVTEIYYPAIGVTIWVC